MVQYSVGLESVEPVCMESVMFVASGVMIGFASVICVQARKSLMYRC